MNREILKVFQRYKKKLELMLLIFNAQVV